MKQKGIDLQSLRSKLEHLIGSGTETEVSGKAPFTPEYKHVLTLASKEAVKLRHRFLGTEHLLLGLLLEKEGVASTILRSHGLEMQSTRNDILKELDPNFKP
jgi:ATP-dependent Clp protease ATP-binding subunit ClpC